MTITYPPTGTPDFADPEVTYVQGAGTPVTRGMLGATVQWPLNNRSIAYEASRVIKSGPGILYGLTVYNSSTSAQFILLFDANTLPADGVIPDVVLVVGAGGTSATVGGLQTWDWVPGRGFHTGIVVCNSSTAVTKTIGSANCWFDSQFL